MMHNDYISKLPKNELLAANQICTDFLGGDLNEAPRDVAYTLEVLLEGQMPAGWEKEVIRTSFFGAVLGLTTPQLSNSERKIYLIHRHVKALLARATIMNPQLVNIYLVELSDGETAKIDGLLAEIRDIIRGSKAISEDHRRRLLKVVNSLQSEVDKEYSDFRVFLDGMVEASEALGDAGENVKPVFDRMKEVLGIADKVRKAKEAITGPEQPKALPAPPKELPAPTEEL
ncbi:MAG: hypothetical protein ABJN34_08780 [Litoreibacter sp.]|uniref:hypothetical protein n=1 Tax=Litoreibacter sp. TaxID=1969459 RepID=UPI0032991764